MAQKGGRNRHQHGEKRKEGRVAAAVGSAGTHRGEGERGRRQLKWSRRTGETYIVSRKDYNRPTSYRQENPPVRASRHKYTQLYRDKREKRESNKLRIEDGRLGRIARRDGRPLNHAVCVNQV